jgi:hypothetical protein
MANFLKRLFGGTERALADPSQSAPPGSRARRFGNDRSSMFDLEQTRVLNAQLHVPLEERDENWSAAFYPAAWKASIELPAKPLIQGPDGFHYLRLDIPAAGSFDSNCLANLAEYCLDNNLGAAFFLGPDAASASCVISLGQLYSMMRYDSWEGDPQDLDERRRGPIEQGVDIDTPPGGGQRLTFRESHEILLGAPSRDFLPSTLAAGLYRHLTMLWGMKEPMVGLLVDPLLAPSRNLLLDCKPENAPAPALLRAHVQLLLWYLPPARSLMLLPDGWSEENMVPLASYAYRTRADRAG